MWVKVGSGDENDDEAGLSHFEIPAGDAQKAQIVDGEKDRVGTDEGDVPQQRMLEFAETASQIMVAT